jgi:hypothetical protein
MSDAPYFSERHGRGQREKSVDLETLSRMVMSVWDDLRAKHYFEYGFGYECVDGDQLGVAGADPDAYFLRVIGRQDIWPYWFVDYREPTLLRKPRAQSWDADTLFDVVEVLHDLVARPTNLRHHTYMNCGDHATAFDQGAGRAEYAASMDDVLRLHRPPLEFGEDGRLRERVPDEFRDLIDDELPDDADQELVTSKVEHARRLFLARSSNAADRRNAVRELADVLEALRQDMKTVMLPKDEDAIFQIANRFAIRHNNRQQFRGYDEDVWLPWMFYVYTATIRAVLQVQEDEG